jgi:hypothetical protein
MAGGGLKIAAVDLFPLDAVGDGGGGFSTAAVNQHRHVRIEFFRRTGGEIVRLNVRVEIGALRSRHWFRKSHETRLTPSP